MLLALVEVGRVAVLYSARYVIIAVLATAVWLPLHLWHLRYGLRGERPPRSGATLAVIALVQFAALVLIGPAWSFMLAALATSSLIVLRWPWSLAMLAVCVVAPVPAVELHRENALALTLGSNDAYLMFAVAFRSGLQFTLVWLVASIHELAASRAVLAREAADREHARLEASMRAMLTSQKAVAASCPAGQSVLGGGVAAGSISTDTLATQQSYPDNNNTQWFGSANDLAANPSPWTLVVYAICANVN